MLKSKALIYLFTAIILMSFANAATIYGIVYDLSLQKVNNARVEINTAPKQFMIGQNGSYSFEVPNGAFKIKSQLIQKGSIIASAEENITVNQDGDYVLDLILLPDIEEGVENVELDVNSDIVEPNANNKSLAGLVALLIILIISIGIYYFAANKKSRGFGQEKELQQEKKESYDEDDELNKLIEIIKNEGGRATQKDIRRQIPLSEAKISLMIAELEHKGIIEKIKKGRGNIIILKKK